MVNNLSRTVFSQKKVLQHNFFFWTLTSSVEFEVKLFLFIFEEVELVVCVWVKSGEEKSELWRHQRLKNGSDRRHAK